MINYEELDEMYESTPRWDAMRKSTDPVGSLTDNRRKVQPARNATRKRKIDWDTRADLNDSWSNWSEDDD